MSYQIETVLYSLRFVERKREYATAFAVLVASGIVIKLCQKLFKKCRLKRKRQWKRKERDEEIARYHASFSEISLDKVSEITQLSASKLIEAIRDGKYTTTEVLQSYQCKALDAHDRTNCVTGFVREAEAEAGSIVRSNTEQLLCGLPVSIKENYGLEGYDTTIGCAQRIGIPCPETATIIKLLRHQGAIPFVRTNVPQTMLSWETSNPIYGVTTNPHDSKRTVGGSSGGEGALIACGGSVLGWGSDIGGSIRIPSSMCGVYGLKTTFGRLSARGTAPLMKGQTLVRSTFGPLARDIDSLILAMKAVCIPKLWELDPTVVPLPFNEQLLNEKKRLTIGYFVDDGFVTSAPAMQRAVRETIQHLQELGHTVAEWKLAKDHTQTIGAVFLTAIFGDTGRSLREYIANDQMDNSMLGLAPLLYMPRFLKRILAKVVRPFGAFGRKTALALEVTCGPDNIYDWWAWNVKAQTIQRNVLDEWELNGFDAVICPGFACPAPHIGATTTASQACSYTMVYNVLDFPAGSMPVTTVSPNDELEARSYPGSDPLHATLKKAMQGTAGLPVNIQVACKPFQEERVLRLMKEIDEVFHGHSN